MAGLRLGVAGGTGVVGHHVVDLARAGGHDVVVLSRSSGVDLVTGTGLLDALDGVDAVIDVTGTQTQSSSASRAFFGSVAASLLKAEQDHEVRHHVALGIVGSDLAPTGYYAGKVVQEQLVEGGPVPWTILRATQFHEFAAQLFGQYRFGPFDLVPRMRSQPVAAREVAARLVSLASGDPIGRARNLAGPAELRMVDMVRAYAASTGARPRLLEIPLPGAFGRAMRDGTLLPVGSYDVGHQTFADWLAERRA